MKYPCVITITTKTDLDWKLNGPVDSYTLSSTTCTTTMESDCTSNFSDDDMEFQNEETNHQIYQRTLFPIETADDHSEYVSVATSDIESVFEVDSQAGDKRPIQAGPKEVSKAVELTRILPRQEQKTSVPESKRLDASARPASKEPVLQRGSKGPHPSSTGSGTNHCPVAPPTFNARSAPVRSEPTIPVNARHPFTRVPNPPTVEKAKPFHARPAPKFNSPKIPVRLRDPSKLRPVFRARPAPTIALPKFPVRDRNPSKLRSAA
jgi:hypothetical protein